jgi:hypothetical protein
MMTFPIIIWEKKKVPNHQSVIYPNCF